MDAKEQPRRIPFVWLALASLVLPPVGIVLWWLLPWDKGLVRRAVAVLGRLAVSLALCILTVLYLVHLNVVNVQLSGSGSMPIFSLHDTGSDQAALERHRAAQREASAHQPGPVPDPPEPPAAEAAPAVDKAPIRTTVRPAAPRPAPLLDPGWTDFRGTNRSGTYTHGPILTSWPADGLKPLWRQPVGGGYTSFVVANGRAFTIEQRREKEVVAAYDVASGREVWTTAWEALFSESLGGDGPRATPVWDAGKLYALGATGEFRCLSAESGRTLWSKNILSDSGAANLPWGMAASPLIVDEQVIVMPGGTGRCLTSYNKHSGKFLWGALDDQPAYVSPVVATLGGERQVVAITGTRVVGLTDAGRLLWEHPWVTMNGINCAQPIVVDTNHIFVSSGYDHGCALIEVTNRDGSFSTRAVWENRNLKNRFNSSVLLDGSIYGFDEGIFACIDARTGERKWKGGRYGHGQLILAGNHIIVLTESGDLVLLKASPESLQEVARFSAISGKTWNIPALSAGILLVRNSREMAAFSLAPTASP